MNQYPKNIEFLEKHHQIFIEQTPTAIAMLDRDMIYLAASKRWLKDFKLEGQNVIGRSHYQVFPEIGSDWKEKHQKCLKGAVDVCDEAPFKRADGSIQWIYWDVRPWYNAQGKIGGLLMHTGDITEQKEKELQNKRIQSILRKTSEIAVIGTWEVDLVRNKVVWSDIVRQIHEVDNDYEPTVENSIEFYSQGESRDLIKHKISLALEHGEPIDIEAEIVTAKGNLRWTKVIGKVIFENGKAVKLYGTLQDITRVVTSEKYLSKANAELRAISNSISIGLIVTDSNGVIQRFNKGAELMLGYKREELIGKKTPEIYLHEDELMQFKEDMSNIIGKDLTKMSYNNWEDKINNTRQWVFRRKDGTTFPALTTVSSILDDNDENAGFIAIATDISKIKEVRDELQRKNELLNYAEQLTLMGNWQWNVKQDRVIWSSNLYQIFGLSEEIGQIKYDTYFHFVHPDDKERVRKHIDNFIKTHQKKGLVHRILLKDGTVKIIKLVGEVVKDENGEIKEMIGACQDVTKTKMVEEKLIHAKEELEEFTQKLTLQNQQLADFTHITSHNLRAPVANLNSLLEIYTYAENDEERTDIFNKFSSVIDHLSSTLNTLIEALKAKVGDANENIEKVYFEDVFKDTSQILSGAILKSNAVIDTDFSQLTHISYNKIYMESIFLNLIGNAIKYSAEDRAPHIEIKTEVKNEINIITFKDNGLGIDLKKHGSKLFGLNKVFHRHPDAKGVGLYLTKTQIEAMGGTISATSEVNVGTTFTIKFN
ncbi:PAS domain S-box protein [Maribacter sp. 1_2014MBL_MicDiv]|uniref:PAS domain S-box protein n=1 Tax=Maribacter sp. 1_2014MBL_MicDiv TaxID=1644130 RepID=UPI0008F45F59|nr:PAS domain S-box protein [Maribacter sp. 1_2014MBL_MicDiv]APA64550.1 hypothetical protein YQ22_09585 [Maribacter sp. 1_2014MBL_MicDiv]